MVPEHPPRPHGAPSTADGGAGGGAEGSGGAGTAPEPASAGDGFMPHVSQ
jgi:hypothetical protein